MRRRSAVWIGVPWGTRDDKHGVAGAQRGKQVWERIGSGVGPRLLKAVPLVLRQQAGEGMEDAGKVEHADAGPGAQVGKAPDWVPGRIGRFFEFGEHFSD